MDSSTVDVVCESVPFNRIPNKLLSHIFLFAKPIVPHLFKDSLPSGFLLVNKRWRFVALGTPHLWTAFQFDLSHSVDSDGLLPATVSTWIKRSLHFPLSIEADMTTPDSNTDLASQSLRKRLGVKNKTMDVICGASSRWRALKMCGVPYSFFRGIFRAADVQAQADRTSCKLEELSVTLQLEGVHYPGVEPPLQLPNIPILHFKGLGLTVSKNFTLTSARQIHLNSIMDAISCIHIITSAPNLEKLRLTFSREHEIAYRGKPILAPKLDLLDFTFEALNDDEPEPTDILLYITAPSLTTFSFTDRHDPFFNLLNVQYFLSRSQCALRRFYYCGRNRPRALLLQHLGIMLRSIPSLEVLEVRCSFNLSGFKDFLLELEREPQDRILPLMTDLVIELDEEEGENDIMGPLKEVVERRNTRNGGRLKRVEILMCSHSYPSESMLLVDEVGRSAFEGLEDTGVRFSMKATRYDKQ